MTECPRYGCKKKPKKVNESANFETYVCECGIEFVVPKEK